MKAAKLDEAVPGRYVLANGFAGEWNLTPEKLADPTSCFLSRDTVEGGERYHVWPWVLFSHAKAIAGAKRRRGMRAIRVRVVLEIL